METSAADVIKLIVTHGPEKYNVELSQSATVGHLSERLEDLTSVPQGGQKIINRGKNLHDHKQTLTEAGVKQGSKLMLIGKKVNPEEDENYKEIVKVEKRIEELVKKQLAIVEEVGGIEKGFLQKELEQESLSRLGKRLALCHEEYVRLLEKLDSLDLGRSSQAIGGKRKSVITAIQGQLDSNDAVDTTIRQLQNPEAS